MNFIVFIDCDGYDMFVVVLFAISSTAGFQDFHKQSSRSIFPAFSSSSSSSTPIASAGSNSDAMKLFYLVFQDCDKQSDLRNSVSLQRVD